MSTPIDVYWAEIGDDEATFDRLHAVLSPAERVEAMRFRQPGDRRRYVVRRGRLRLLLARYVGRAPGELQFVRSPFGKPALPNSDVRFSLSSSHGVVLFAFARGCEVGCDVERADPAFAFAPVAERLFSPVERRLLASFAAERRVDAFFRCWTRKEAYVKARGDGLSRPLDRFDVLPDSDAPVCDGWSIRSLSLLPGYAAAVAAPGSNWSVCVQQVPSSDVGCPA